MNFRIRIISDLHIGHKASLIKDPRSLMPLSRGVDMLVFNGDTVESKFADSKESRINPLPTLEEVQSTVDKWGVKALYLTGNHDPGINDFHYLRIARDEILITHGDGVFENIAPWSHNAKALENAVRQQLDGKDSLDFQIYLQAIKDAENLAHQQSPEHNPTVWGKMHMFAKQAWPPNHIFKILGCWNQAPRNAVKMANRFGLQPKFLIIGHTHKPGLWKVGDTWVLNTGSFFLWPGASCVDITQEGLSYRRVSKLGNRFRPGSEIRHFSLSDSTVEACRSLLAGKKEKLRNAQRQIHPKAVNSV